MNQVIDRKDLVSKKVGGAACAVSDARWPVRLLCATDLSKRSDAAVRRAAHLSRELGAELLLFHSVEAANSDGRTRRKRAHAQATLGERASKLTYRGCVPKISVRVGRYLDTIVQMASDWDADMIILGSHRKRFGESIAGTTAERVIRAAHRPVLVVNRDTVGSYQHALLASDLSKASVGAARVTQDLGLLNGCALSVVHSVTPAGHSMLRMSGVGDETVDEYVRQTAHWTSKEMQRQLAKAGLRKARTWVMVRQPSPIAAIDRAMRLTRADLVIVGASRFPALKRILVGSVSNEVLRRLDCDVLLVSPNAIKQANSAAHAARSAPSRTDFAPDSITVDGGSAIATLPSRERRALS